MLQLLISLISNKRDLFAQRKAPSDRIACLESFNTSGFFYSFLQWTEIVHNQQTHPTEHDLRTPCTHLLYLHLLLDVESTHRGPISMSILGTTSIGRYWGWHDGNASGERCSGSSYNDLPSYCSNAETNSAQDRPTRLSVTMLLGYRPF